MRIFSWGCQWTICCTLQYSRITLYCIFENFRTTESDEQYIALYTVYCRKLTLFLVLYTVYTVQNTCTMYTLSIQVKTQEKCLQLYLIQKQPKKTNWFFFSPFFVNKKFENQPTILAKDIFFCLFYSMNNFKFIIPTNFFLLNIFWLSFIKNIFCFYHLNYFL